jgi:phosphatidylglycerol:prolipoprotein diacylglycerol transferase
MRPELFRIPLPPWDGLPADLPIRGYGAMLALGFLVAILVAAWRARREGENPDHVFNMGILALLGGILGARIFDVIEYSATYPDWTRGFNLLDGMSLTGVAIGLVVGGVLSAVGVLPGPRATPRGRRIAIAAWAVFGALVVGRGLYIRQTGAAALAAGEPDPYAGFIEALKVTSGGLTAYGGIIMAIVLIVPYLLYIRYRHGVNPLKMADIVAPSLAIGLIFGRLGCFLNGCCWGAPTNVPWAFTWPEGSLPWNAGLHGPIHPAQLYSSFNGLLLFLLLHLGYRFKKRHGVVLAGFFGLYAVSRFLIEDLRADEAKTYLGGLSISQAVSVFVLAGVAVYIVWLRFTPLSDLRWQPKKRPPAPAGNAGRRKC